jgi:hypothetical protein
VSSASSSGGVPAGRRLIALVLAVAGIIGVVIGLLFLFTATSLPSMVQGSSHTGHHIFRATFSIVLGLVLVAMAALIGRGGHGASGQ